MKTLKVVSIALSILFTIPVQAGDSAAGQKLAEGACVACHGAQGNKPIDPSYPKLAGQYEDYLIKVLGDYKSGARKNAIMGAQAANLSKKDIQDIAAYFSNQPDGVQFKK